MQSSHQYRRNVLPAMSTSHLLEVLDDQRSLTPLKMPTITLLRGQQTTQAGSMSKGIWYMSGATTCPLSLFAKSGWRMERQDEQRNYGLRRQSRLSSNYAGYARSKISCNEDVCILPIAGTWANLKILCHVHTAVSWHFY